MKLFVVLASVCLLFSSARVYAARADDMGRPPMVGSSYGGGSEGGSYGGGASIPAPPCPKNYLFSCQPSLSPAPCSQSSGGYGGGSAGAYSDNYPVYAYPVPQYINGFQAY